MKKPATKNGSWRNIITTPHIDREIVRIYQSGKRGAIKAFAEKIDRPYAWVRYRAEQLGIRNPRCKPHGGIAWNDPQELEIVETWAHCNVLTIQRKLKKAGYYRRPYAIENQVRKMKLDRMDPDYYRGIELAGLLGVSHQIIGRWVKNGFLEATKRDNRLRMYSDDVHQLWIKRTALKTFIREYPQMVDLRKVDRLWFIDLVLGAPRGIRIAMTNETKKVA